MLHKIIGHGSNGSRGVMDYMLKEKDKRTPRKGVTVLRGDIETQAKLIDSLVGKFKQQYVTGVFSFEEAPEQITDDQKNEIMDGAEKTILAGLDPNRISITWIEHTDKGRLELNYIVACVDLEHGRLFQPYVHSHDQDRFNAFRDIQNIKHGYSEPNDPAKAQTLSQTDKLPRTTKELKEAITAELEKQAIVGLIINRDDVKQAFSELGYTITRAGKDYISIKNPDPKGQNIKFKSTNDGGLYDIKFNASAENASEISRASADFARRSRERFAAAQKVYDKEFDRKREYHQKRHSRPKFEQRRAAKAFNPAFARYTAFDGRYARTVPNPYTDTLRKRNKRDSADDRELYNEHAELDRAARASVDRDSKIANKALASLGFNRLRNSDDLERVHWSHDSEISNRLTDPNIQTRPLHETEYLLSRDRINEQAAIRSSQSSIASSARYDSSPEMDHRTARARDRDQRASYSSIDSIIKSISKDSSAGAASIAKSIQRVKNIVEWNNNRISELAKGSRNATEFAERTDRRADKSREQTVRVDESIKELSARHAELRDFKDRYNKNRKRVEQVSEITITNQQLKKSYDDYTERNRDTSNRLKQTSTAVGGLITAQKHVRAAEQVRQAEVARKQAELERSRSSSPRPF